MIQPIKISQIKKTPTKLPIQSSSISTTLTKIQPSMLFEIQTSISSQQSRPNRKPSFPSRPPKTRSKSRFENTKEMKLWQRASGLIKDQNSIWIASLTRKTTLRNPDVERAVIRATSHDNSRIDFKNAQKVFAWIRLSSAYIKPLTWAISVRMDKTRSWVVALKGLMLMHGVFSSHVPAAQKFGRLPFDLSNFNDTHDSPRKTWGHNNLIRAYYAFLDKKSTMIFLHKNKNRGKSWSCVSEGEHYSMKRDIIGLQKLQNLLDLLLKIKPLEKNMVNNTIVLEAMDCVIVEIFDIYSRLCNGIARVLMRICSAGKVEATMALKVLRKATVQSEELSEYFNYCKDMGVIHASDCPKVEQIPESDIIEIEQIINGVAARSESNQKDERPKKSKSVKELKKNSKNGLQTIITNKWEVFDEEQSMKKNVEGEFAVQAVDSKKSDDLPDLISFF